MRKITGFFVLMSYLFLSICAFADNNMKLMGTYGSWRLYQYASKNGSKECFMTCTPSKSKGDYSKRGHVRLFITNRPADKAQGEVSFQAGYGYKEGANATLKIDQSKYQMPTKSEGAWLSSPVQDQEAVSKMINGKTLIIEGASAKGTSTVDEFSLSGFSKAYQAMNKTCPVKGMSVPLAPAAASTAAVAAKVVDNKADNKKMTAKKAVAKKTPVKKAPARKASKAKARKKK